MTERELAAYRDRLCAADTVADVERLLAELSELSELSALLGDAPAVRVLRQEADEWRAFLWQLHGPRGHGLRGAQG
ncbi:hypothetical protein J421_0039 [Gemmatirosa kalamazoonensis]|uniref:Uncharacterized protein n=1 Tax=Gemmatirosa kalamazoonensis TaxID=861299 RepID=W0RB63_9BACT|nr:hypothetical protein [Gemmatirosa kalamazoonensis]AHG87555.1 hypothetical protein J421_0017 [Gemmatirosa kalamazoonensis]AHG87576.1 hypothetical protein J421_0039 [Gemmatirosa kalamazoonensis]